MARTLTSKRFCAVATSARQSIDNLMWHRQYPMSSPIMADDLYRYFDVKVAS